MAAEQASGGFGGGGRRLASMSTGNLKDLYAQHAQQQPLRLDSSGLGSGMPGGAPALRGVASTPSMWDGQLPVRALLLDAALHMPAGSLTPALSATRLPVLYTTANRACLGHVRCHQSGTSRRCRR